MDLQTILVVGVVEYPEPDSLLPDIEAVAIDGLMPILFTMAGMSIVWLVLRGAFT